MTFKNIVTKKTYQKDGQEKTVWLKVGTIRTTDDGKEFLELNMYPNTPFYVFENEKKDDYESQVDKQFEQIASQKVDTTHKTHDPETNQDISLDSIPF